MFIYAANDHLPIVGLQSEVNGALALLLARKATKAFMCEADML